MIKLNNYDIIIDSSEFSSKESIINLNTINNFKHTDKSSLKLFKAEFSCDFKSDLEIIKKLNLLCNSGFSFGVQYGKYNLVGIVDFAKNSPINSDILCALKAIFIKDKSDRINYLYDNIFSYLDSIWKQNNPCNFCDNKCIASRNKTTAHEENGCCYSFNYSKNPLKLIEDVKVCKYLSDDKHCLTENISCKLFVCKYLKKNHLFNIDIKNIFLIQAFFTKKQQLILTQNFFKSKEEIIDKLLEDINNIPYFFYYLSDDYRIKGKN